uniref:uncharacterized protein LOC122608993 n=1 Tax=Erigeron canadensis TaxID=72917 RepID=UPI001CB94C67|nr:uncharacterized protein LOC122608993 [Erigeron canadensis]
MDCKIASWNVRGINTEYKHNEAIMFIRDEKLQVCALLETHLKSNTINKVGDRVFNTWEWVSNIQFRPTCCRMLVGWNPSAIRLMVIDTNKQSMLCLIEVISSHINFFCTFVYACNSGVEIRVLWKELYKQRQFVGMEPWALMGDFNITLDVSEHSNGGAFASMDMHEFLDTINELEVEDICSSGFKYTWTKSLKNKKCGTLKKLDRILINEEFMKRFKTASGLFIPYLVYDHSPAKLIFKNGQIKKHKAFRFKNFVTERNEFLELVKKEWDEEVAGCHMYKLVQKLKKLKKPLNKLSWSTGNVYERVIQLKGKLKKDQAVVDTNPHNVELKAKAMNILNI